MPNNNIISPKGQQIIAKKELPAGADLARMQHQGSLKRMVMDITSSGKDGKKLFMEPLSMNVF